MGRTYKDESLQPGTLEVPGPATNLRKRRERTAIVTPAGSVSMVDGPDGWPNELLIAGDSYGKTLFAPAKGQLRIIYTRLYPLPQSVQQKLARALLDDDEQRR